MLNEYKIDSSEIQALMQQCILKQTCLCSGNHSKGSGTHLKTAADRERKFVSASTNASYTATISKRTQNSSVFSEPELTSGPLVSGSHVVAMSVEVESQRV